MGLGITYHGKRPAEIPAAIAVCVLIFCWIRFILIANNSTLIELILAYLVIVTGLLFIGVSIFRWLTFSQIFAIEMKPEALGIKNSEIPADKIKNIFIKGYFQPVIGIKLKGQMLVSYKHNFRFSEQEDQAIRELKEWADQHHIEVLHRRFKRWL
jgi:hypothetical protein